MCGIVGYVGTQNASPILLEGLTRLEYRGYDSAGVAVLGSRAVHLHRVVGRVRDLTAILPKRLAGKVGIGHTRWATHGAATLANAHPHTSEDGRIAVVHNGIIDNADTLRSELAKDGTRFASETDSEVIAHLIAKSTALTLEDAVVEAISCITGTYAIVVIDKAYPDRLVVARNGSPLIIGVGDHEMFIASDLAALVRHTSQIISLDDGEFASVQATGYRTFTVDEQNTGKVATAINIKLDDVSLAGYQHFMRKEIQEQPESLERMIRGRLDPRFGVSRLDGLNLTPRELRGFNRIKILGCGSAYYVGQIGALMIEEIARIPADAEAASEFRYRNPIIEADTLYIAVSQSGETADTAFAVNEIKRKGGRVVGLINVVGSTIARACEGGVYLHAGPEISVASTKALTNMAVGFALIALQFGRVRDLSNSDGQRIVEGIQALPDQIRAILDTEHLVEGMARECAGADSLFFIGRVRGFPVAREGAQKFKEISYRHAEAYQTSELKHGPLALIDSSIPTIAIVPEDNLTERNVSSIQQIVARNGPVLAVTHCGVQFGDLNLPRITVPKNEPELDPVLLTIPLQLLAYHAALMLGHDVDKPRNLAKSVTVE
ncbi:glutamine--fructose-6-phosphate transaminase (isomerizing) [Mycobacteroides abscessus]